MAYKRTICLMQALCESRKRIISDTGPDFAGKSTENNVQLKYRRKKMMLPLIRSRRSTPSVFDDFFGSNFWNDLYENSGYKGTPNVNVYEGKDNYEIEVAAPGLDKKDFHIDLKDNVLTVSSEKKEENEKKEGNKVVCCEFNYSSFSRSFQLPDGIDVSKISANHNNGVLKITLPKREEYIQKAPRMIEIS